MCAGPGYDGDLAGLQNSDGSIRARYAVQGIPAVFVLDERGIIRDRDVRGKALDDAVDRLITSTR